MISRDLFFAILLPTTEVYAPLLDYFLGTVLLYKVLTLKSVRSVAKRGFKTQVLHLWLGWTLLVVIDLSMMLISQIPCARIRNERRNLFNVMNAIQDLAFLLQVVFF